MRGIGGIPDRREGTKRLVTDLDAGRARTVFSLGPADGIRAVFAAHEAAEDLPGDSANDRADKMRGQSQYGPAACRAVRTFFSSGPGGNDCLSTVG